MNKYEEALEKIRKHCLSSPAYGQGKECGFGSDYDFNNDGYEYETGLLQELVDKATPKKPYGYHTHYNCPSCQKRVRSGKGSSSLIRDTVCRSCYQVLDWSTDD